MSPGAVSLARVLLALEKTRQTGVLAVWNGAARCNIAIEKGTPRAAAPPPGEDDTLGDALLRQGLLNSEAHQKALYGGEPDQPVGDWLVRVGAATRPAVEYALRRQLQNRIQRLFGWPAMDCRFKAGDPEIGAPLVREPVCVADLVLGGLRRAMADEQPQQLGRQLELAPGVLRVTPLGRSLLERAALWPEETALLALLDSGSDMARIAAATHGSERVRRTLAALLSVRAVTRDLGKTTDARCALLLRKKRQLRQAKDAVALLDLPPGAKPENARKALRRLARELHPDRFGPKAPAALRSASMEVMKALSSAEEELRAPVATRPDFSVG